MFISEAYKTLAFVLSFVNLGLIITCITLPDWRVNDVEGEVLEYSKRTQGLYTKCTFFATGNWQCEDYDKFFIALPTEIVAARVFTSLCLIFQILTWLSLPFGMYCVRLPDNELIKNKIILINSAFSILCSILIGTSVSWYASSILKEYRGANNLFNYAGRTSGLQSSLSDTLGTRYIYGTALYIGWACMALLLVQGVLLICAYNKSNVEDNQDYNDYANNTKFGDRTQTLNTYVRDSNRYSQKIDRKTNGFNSEFYGTGKKSHMSSIRPEPVVNYI